MTNAAALLDRLDAVDAALVAKRWPGLSPWWRATLATFLASGRRQLVLRVGRRGGKSSSLCELAVVVALYFATLGLIPPGDIGWVVFVSVSRDEAAARLHTIKKILEALGVGYVPDGDTVTLTGFNVGFRVLTASVSGVSGWTSILIVADELAKWLDKSTGANPATEVLAALRPTGATTDALVILSSSPLTDEDVHARAFAEGDDEHQQVAFAPTWVANPTLSEAATRKLERDERIWRREYAAIPQPAILDGYLADVIAQCTDKDRKAGERLPAHDVETTRYTLAIDAAWRGDEFAWAISHEEGDTVIVDDVGGWLAARGQVLNVEKTCDALAEIAEEWGVDEIIADQKDFDALAALLRLRGIRLIGRPWTSANKVGTFRRFRSLAMDARVRLPNEPKTIAQLESIGIRMTPSGQETFEGRGADDRAFAVVLSVTEAIGKSAPVIHHPAPPLISFLNGGGGIDGYTPIGSQDQVFGETRPEDLWLQNAALSALNGR